ncbi:MAG: hypothetical protein HC929_13810 [Leptolyngbyaceae cyanobacterium SM2_5_2]|nr:hypothetical protein [Leptolyngbyaceae cyanobacterium SM2_5_2]
MAWLSQSQFPRHQTPAATAADLEVPLLWVGGDEILEEVSSFSSDLMEDDITGAEATGGDVSGDVSGDTVAQDPFAGLALGDVADVAVGDAPPAPRDATTDDLDSLLALVPEPQAPQADHPPPTGFSHRQS